MMAHKTSQQGRKIAGTFTDSARYLDLKASQKEGTANCGIPAGMRL